MIAMLHSQNHTLFAAVDNLEVDNLGQLGLWMTFLMSLFVAGAANANQIMPTYCHDLNP